MKTFETRPVYRNLWWIRLELVMKATLDDIRWTGFDSFAPVNSITAIVAESDCDHYTH